MKVAMLNAPPFDEGTFFLSMERAGLIGNPLSLPYPASHALSPSSHRLLQILCRRIPQGLNEIGVPLQKTGQA